MLRVKSIVKNIQNWLIERRHQILLFLIAFLIATISFGLGYLIRGDIERAPIIIEKIAR